MTQTKRYKIRNSFIGAAIFVGIAGIASAGAPGTVDSFAPDQSVMLINPDERFEPTPQLSPAEIRNAVSVRMDRASSQGFDVDRASVDGIGLELASEERLVEAHLR